MSTISLAQLDQYLQDKLVHTIDSPLTTEQRVRGINQIIQFLQSEMNLKPTKRINPFDYLRGENDYSLVNDLGLSDVKDIKDIRDPNSAYTLFEDIDNKTMAQYLAEHRLINARTIESRDDDEILRVIYRNANTRLLVSQMDSLTDNGTWSSDTTNSDATTLAIDSNRKKQGGASFKFNIDVSQSTNNYTAIKNTTLTALDLSNYENIATWRASLDLLQMTDAQLALISNIEIRFGSSSSAYWKITSSTPVNFGAFKKSWNRMSWNWRDAEKTGSPDSSEVDYVELRINYTSGMTDVQNVRFDDLVLILPKELEIVYFSTYMVKDGATWQEEFSTDEVDTKEVILLPTRHRLGFLDLVAELLFMQMKEKATDQVIFEQLKGTKAFQAIFDDIGEPIVKNIGSIQVQGNAVERADGGTRMWM